MPHEFESGFFVKQPAWHGLGKVVEQAPSIEEAIKLAGLDWEVELRPLFSGVYDAVTEQPVVGDCLLASKNRAVVRKARALVSEPGSILGVVGTGYVPLQNTEAFKYFEPLVEDGLVELETAGSLKRGQHVWVLARCKDQAEVVTGDAVRSYLLLSNAHDGTRAVTVQFTSIRVVCWNTLSMSLNAGDSGRESQLRVVHNSGVIRGLEAARDVVDLNARAFRVSVEQYRKLQRKDLPIKGLEKYVAEVVEADIHADEYKTPRCYGTIERLMDEGAGVDIPGVAGTYWAAYNAVTEWVDHHRDERKGIDHRLYNAWFGSGGQIKRRALEVALNYAN